MLIFLFISNVFDGFVNVPLKLHCNVIIITALSGSEASGDLALKKNHFFSKVNNAIIDADHALISSLTSARRLGLVS